MKRSRKIAAIITLAIVCIPLIMVFNDDASTIYINFIGLLYGFIVYKFGRLVAPQYVLDYLDEELDEGREEDYE